MDEEVQKLKNQIESLNKNFSDFMLHTHNGFDSSPVSLIQNVRYLIFSLVDSAVDVAVDTDIGGDFTIPFNGTVLRSNIERDLLAATTDTAGTTGTMVVDIHLNGTTIMATDKLDIETTEKGTQTASTQPVLTTVAINMGDILTFDIDAIHTTPSKGLTVYMAIRE